MRSRSRAATPPRPLLVVSQSLGGGGTERVITILLRHLDRREFQPSLALFDARGPFLADVPPDVRLYDLGERNPYDVWRAAAGLRRVIRSARPAVVLSLLRHPNLMTLAVCRMFFPGVPVVVSERTPLSVGATEDRGRLLKRFLHRRLYRHARGIIAISSTIGDELQQRFGLRDGRVQVIHNPCETERIRRLAREEPTLPVDWRIPTVVAAGRLTRQKGFSYLLEAVAIVARRRSFQLLILGDGEDRSALSRQAAALEIADRVLMPGFQANPFAYMARGRAFVLASLWEGFGNVIVEAMACGVPVISTDCPGGPGEIITHEANGLLVPPADAGALAHALTKVLADPALARWLARGGLERAEAFSADVVVSRYERALQL